MIPEVGKKVEKAFPSDYPIGHLIFALGFFFVFFIEQMVTMCCMKKTVPAGDNHEDHDHDEAKNDSINSKLLRKFCRNIYELILIEMTAKFQL